MALPRREHYGAALVPVRTAEGGGLEVLLCQNLVVDFVKSTSASGDGVSIRSYPGELRFLGSRAAMGEESTPLDTAVRDLTPAGWPDILATILAVVSARPDGGSAAARADVRPALFSVSEKLKDECFRLYSFVCAVGDAQNDSLSQALNEQMHSQLDACDAYGDEFFHLSVEARAALTPKLRMLEWRKVKEVREEAAAEREFVNDWQKDMFRRYGLSQRQVAWATIETLDRLSRFDSAEEVLAEARRFEQTLRRSSGSELLRSLPDLAVCLPNLEQLVVLSYNLNILPWGASYFGSGQGHASAERLNVFFEHVADQPSSERPDVLAIQELFGTPFLPCLCQQRRFIERMASLGYSAVTSSRPKMRALLSTGKWTDSGLVVFSRLPIAVSGELAFEAGTGLDAGASKGAIWARVRLAAGKFLDVFNCHLQATHSGDGDFEAVRRRQLTSLRQFITVRSGSQPYVLTGDFNVDAIAEPDDPRGAFGYALRPPAAESSDYRSMINVLDPYDELADLLLLSAGKPTGGLRSHPCTRPPRQHLPTTANYTIKHKHTQRLDYVFFRPTVSSLVEHVSSEVAEFRVSGHSNFTYLSDHWGIKSTFGIKCGFGWKDSRVEDVNEHELSSFSEKSSSSATRFSANTSAVLVSLFILAVLCFCVSQPWNFQTILALVVTVVSSLVVVVSCREATRRSSSGSVAEAARPAHANNA
eukprot:TRINITY_DN58812_c0_g1_i1.p1 TRINITY_DN58812_c0_g1~~TRINITY_DN58812_c0_g1_i1.p1  ORF type:complete len:704 (+),score=76.32 TRINITY_DN58812_c0_g1_i1:80-2191(+)